MDTQREVAKKSIVEVKEIEKILNNENYLVSNDLFDARNTAVTAELILKDVITANS